MMNKRAWLKIVEAFVAVLLISAVAIIIISRNTEDTDLSGRVYETEITILREIQLNNTLRESVLASIPPVESGDVGFPENIEAKILERTPNYAKCMAKICIVQDSCYLESYPETEETYAKSVIITVSRSSTSYEPKQLKLFCWIV